VTDGSGNLVVKENFGAAGARRGDNWTGKPTTAELTTIDGLTHRGFTFQERLDNLNLTNFNGRIYGETGQFFPPDPNLGDPTNTQSYNRYRYVLNNPLSRTDPTGFFSPRGSAESLLRQEPAEPLRPYRANDCACAV
jgi:RHS repeat-associated protein